MEQALDGFVYNGTVFLIAIVAAGSEIMTRYRDEPFRAVFNLSGLSYLAINGIIAIFVYLKFGLEIDETKNALAPAFATDPLFNALLVGSGAMVVLRAKLFTIRSEDGKEFSFGPSVFVEALLSVVDRQIDRQRASRRHTLVFQALQDVEDFDRALAYFQTSLLTFQNLSQSEKEALNTIVEEYKEIEQWSSGLKTTALGLALLTIAGEGNFTQFADGLRAYLGANGGGS